MFERLSDEGLAQTSYLIACERTRTAIVIDPRRDIDAYTAIAARHGLTIAFAIETHIHADFVSGARELAALGARVVAGPGAALRFPFHEASRRRDSARRGHRNRSAAHARAHARAHLAPRPSTRSTRARLHRRHAVRRSRGPPGSARRGPGARAGRTAVRLALWYVAGPRRRRRGLPWARRGIALRRRHRHAPTFDHRSGTALQPAPAAALEGDFR